jgi:hypothetical protein
MNEFRNFLHFVSSWQFLLITFLIVSHIDVYITMIGVMNFGIEQEANSLTRIAVQTKNPDYAFYDVLIIIVFGFFSWFAWNFNKIDSIITQNYERRISMGKNPVAERKKYLLSLRLTRLLGIYMKLVLWTFVIFYFIDGPMSWVTTPMWKSFLTFKY